MRGGPRVEYREVVSKSTALRRLPRAGGYIVLASAEDYLSVFTVSATKTDVVNAVYGRGVRGSLEKLATQLGSTITLMVATLNGTQLKDLKTLSMKHENFVLTVAQVTYSEGVILSLRAAS